MLTLRSAQVEAFDAAAVKDFEELMVPHLKKFFPEFFEAAGEPKVREFIRYGVKRSGSYQITAKRDVSRYIDLMVSLGRDFDQDPDLSWAGEILRTCNSADTKITVLLKNAEKHLKGA
ncbi:MAG: hypothetical protein ABSG32_27460 [Terriglobia bacterium]|jgi:hypothetical protein